jgi:uncharacterized protein YjbJ (UPF0337 family)
MGHTFTYASDRISEPLSASIRYLIAETEKLKGSIVKKEHLKSDYNETVGKAKEEIGEATDDKSLEAKGHAQQAKGKVQDAVGDLKDIVS